MDRGFWVTPRANDAKQSAWCSGANGKRIDTLTGQARKWPTPAARDYRHPNSKSYQDRGGGSKGEQLPNAVGGSLNPTWVEWLMGLPLGWTDVSGS
jgi:hypothetical protein